MTWTSHCEIIHRDAPYVRLMYFIKNIRFSFQSKSGVWSLTGWSIQGASLRHKIKKTNTIKTLPWVSCMFKIGTTFSLFTSLQLNASSQNMVSNGESATLDGERSSKKSLRPGMTDFSIANPMAPARKLNLSMSRSVTQASLPIHWRGGEGLRDSSSSRILKSPVEINATTTLAVDLEGRSMTYTNNSYNIRLILSFITLLS